MSDKEAMISRPAALVRPVRDTHSTAMLEDRPRSMPRPLMRGVSIFQVPLNRKQPRNSSQKGRVRAAWARVLELSAPAAGEAAAGRCRPAR